MSSRLMVAFGLAAFVIAALVLADAAGFRPQLSMSERCVGDDEVSAFKCRNTWLASSRHAVR